jgi:putative ABC transport system permease protein
MATSASTTQSAHPLAHLSGTILLAGAGKMGSALLEGWLALGASSRQAVHELARRSAARALVPALDQTRNVGLVVLPGAFVGLLLGGATPLEAGRVQLLVLVGLIAAETVAAVSVTSLLSTWIALHRPEAAGN